MASPIHIPAFQFKDGALHISSPLQTLRIRWGDMPTAEEHTRDGRWRGTTPEIRLLKPRQTIADQNSDDRTAAFEAFRAAIPPKIVELVEPFPSHQWSMMVLLHYSKPAMDLAISNRVLAYALASNAEFRGGSDRLRVGHAIRNARKKQREICKALGFPGTEAMVRLARKIMPESCSPPMLRLLRLALKQDKELLARLGHLQRIHSGVVYLMVHDGVSRMLSPRLIKQVSESNEEALVAHTADMLINIAHQMSGLPVPVKLPRLLSIRAVNQLHDRMAAIKEAQLERLRHARATAKERDALRQAQFRAITRGGAVEFPSPPVPGNDSIRPITDSQDLRKESTVQNNCVRNHAHQVIDRQCYIYRVMAPERATLSIVSGTDGWWRIGQLKLAHNRNVSPATRDAVNLWLGKYGMSF